MSTSGGSPEQGWYRQQDGQERFWDGHQWTDHYRDPNAPPPSREDRSPSETLRTEPGKPKSGAPFWIGLAAAGLLAFACCGGDALRGGDDDDDDYSGAALTACQNAVKDRIKNPSTANFALFDTTITETSISGEVTAQNDFGAEKTLRYRCAVSGSTVTNVTVIPV